MGDRSSRKVRCKVIFQKRMWVDEREARKSKAIDYVHEHLKRGLAEGILKKDGIVKEVNIRKKENVLNFRREYLAEIMVLTLEEYDELIHGLTIKLQNGEPIYW